MRGGATHNLAWLSREAERLSGALPVLHGHLAALVAPAATPLPFGSTAEREIFAAALARYVACLRRRRVLVYLALRSSGGSDHAS